MVTSRIFRASQFRTIEKAIVHLINSEPDFLSVRTATSPRAAGDAIQTILSERFESLLGNWMVEYSGAGYASREIRRVDT